MSEKKLSYRKKLLFAALLIDRWSGVSAFTRDDLVVAAWRLWPESFGLSGHDYPCSGRVVAKLSGRTGLVGQGLLRHDDGVFRLTPKGRLAAQALCAPVAVGVAAPVVRRLGRVTAPRSPRPLAKLRTRAAPTPGTYPTYTIDAGSVATPQWETKARPVLMIPSPPRLLGSPMVRPSRVS